ncbi:BrnA antitoxin family protein [Acidiferrobacter sp.]|uniref:BrnA antitoxin family protein n=1 Tax=Acidiferrobacter sp. TaxID=1872107 RepID=UPI0034239E57
MRVKSKSGRVFKLPTVEEESAIRAGVAEDPDTYELTDTEFRQLKRMGRPPAATTKERVTMRLSRDVVARFRAAGPGWQTRIDAALKEWLETHH